MKANYHTHTWRCKHASGREREYVEHAIAGGLKILGFSDHTPYPFPGGFTSGFRMRVDQLEDYVNTVLALKDEYRDEIVIHLGLEAEYYPAYFADLQRLLKEYPIEYLLLAQHFLGNELGDVYSGAETKDERILERYCRQVTEGMETGCFTYLAHPDLLRFTGDPEVYDKYMRQLCRAAGRCGIPLEMNFLGIRENRHYPREQFWKIAGEEGCTVIFGADAHQPEAVWNPETQKAAEKMAQRFRLQVTETVPFRRPF